MVLLEMSSSLCWCDGCVLKETTADSDLKLLRRVGLVWYCLLLR